MPKRFSFVFLMACVISANTSTSIAQLTGWSNVYPGLNGEDVEILQNTARVEMNDKPEGTILKWNNPKTGAKGVVKLIKRYYEEGRECRENQHAFRVRDSSPWKMTGTICRQEDGSWKVLQ